jgi:hypothetical protein
MQPSGEHYSDDQSNDEPSSDKQCSHELSLDVQHGDGPSIDGDPSPSSDIQFNDNKFCSKLPVLDDDDDDDPTTSLLPSFPK